MAHINLLPWREEAQKAKQQEFFVILGAVAILSLTISFLVGQFYQMRIDGQNAKNQFLKNEIQILDIRIQEIKGLTEKKKELESRISVVQQLQRSRNVGTQVLDEITKIVPNGVYLTSMKKEGNILILLGKSESNNHLANMMRAVESSDLLMDAQLDSIQSDKAKDLLLSSFEMRVRIKGLDNMDAATKQGAK